MVKISDELLTDSGVDFGSMLKSMFSRQYAIRNDQELSAETFRIVRRLEGRRSSQWLEFKIGGEWVKAA